MRRLYERRAGHVEELSFGVAVVTPQLPAIRALNSCSPPLEGDRLSRYMPEAERFLIMAQVRPPERQPNAVVVELAPRGVCPRPRGVAHERPGRE
jgi:hypothetical protein